MLFKKISTQGGGIIRVKHVNNTIWQGIPNPFIINDVNFRNFVTSFNDTKKPTTISNVEIASTNNIEFMRGTKIKNMSFTTTEPIDTYLLVTFACKEINYLKTFSVDNGSTFDSDFLTNERRTAMISKLNSNLNRDWILYFSIYDRKRTSESNVNLWLFFKPKLRIDYY